MLELALPLLVDAVTGTTSSTPTLVYILAALIAGGGIGLLANLVRYWRRGQVEDTEMIARITKDTVTGAKDILAEYRLEVEIVKRQLEEYRVQLYDMMKSLAVANSKIDELQHKLDKERQQSQQAHEERVKLSKDLEVAIRERHQLLEQIDSLHQEIRKLLEATDGISEPPAT